MARSHREVEVLEPDQGDVRLAAVGAEPVAWAEPDVLTIAVRQSRKAPSVVGTVVDPMPGSVLYQPTD